MAGTGIGKSSGGRPPERDEAKRSAIAVRTTPRTKAALQEAADRNGRSLTQEIEQRLERSFELEATWGGASTAALIARIVEDIGAIERRSGKAWSEDARTFGAVRHAILEAVEDRIPIPDKIRPVLKDLAIEQSNAQAVVRFAQRPAPDHLSDDEKSAWEKARELAPAEVQRLVSEGAEKLNALLEPVWSEAERGLELYQEIRDARSSNRWARR